MPRSRPPLRYDRLTWCAASSARPPPDRLWVADFTYIPTWTGMACVAFVIDACSRRILGWRTARSMKTALVLGALEQALWARRKDGAGDLSGLVYYTDAGSQYTSIAFTERLAAAGVSGSVGTVGDACDNALAESVIGLFKTELIKPRGPWRPPSRSSSPPWSRSTGSATGGSTRPAGTSLPQTSRPPITVRMPSSPRPARQQPESPDSPGRFRLPEIHQAPDPAAVVQALDDEREKTAIQPPLIGIGPLRKLMLDITGTLWGQPSGTISAGILGQPLGPPALLDLTIFATPINGDDEIPSLSERIDFGAAQLIPGNQPGTWTNLGPVQLDRTQLSSPAAQAPLVHDWLVQFGTGNGYHNIEQEVSRWTGITN